MDEVYEGAPKVIISLAGLNVTPHNSCMPARRRSLLTAVLFCLLPIGCDSGTGPGENEAPVLTELSPASILSGSPTTVLTVIGRGFVTSTRIRIDGTDRPTTFHNGTTLTTTLSASELSSPRELSISVLSPSPGGGASGALALMITAFTPVIEELRPSAVPVGQASALLEIVGTGFRPGAVVSWDGANKPTTRSSSSLLQVILGPTDLATAGGHLIRVRHLANPVDSSNGRLFSIANPAPVILSVAPLYASAGRSEFSLTIEGARFAPGAELQWNDAPRPTTFVSPTRLVATIAATDVVLAGSASLQVWNPAPAVGPSNLVSFPIQPSGRHILRYDVGDIAWDSVRGRLYACLRTTDPTFPNEVIALDPLSGDVLQRVYVGSDPLRMAIADDASVLYVALDGAAAIRIVDLATFTAGSQFPVGMLGNRIMYADDMEVMPGRPGTLAISPQIHGLANDKIAQVLIFDDGIARPAIADGGTVIEFAGPDTLYGFNNASSGFNVFRLLATDSGAVVDTWGEGLMYGFFAHFRYMNGLLYGSDGSVVDGRQMTRRGFVSVGGTVAADLATGRVFYLWENTLTAIDGATLATVGSEVLTGLPLLDQPGYFYPFLVRWGVDGFAYRTFDSLVLFRSNVANP